MVGSRFMVHNRFMVWGRCYITGRCYIWGRRHIWGRGCIWDRGCIGGRCCIWGRGCIWGRCYIRGRCFIWSRFMVWCRCVIRGRFGSVPFTGSTLHTILEITSADILVEDCAVSTLESVLLAILMAEVVNLTACLSICVVPAGVWLAAAVKIGVGLRHGDGEGLHRLRLMWSAFKQDWSYRCRGTVWLWGVCRLGLSIGRFCGIGRCWGIGRCRGITKFRHVCCCWFRGIARF